MVNSIGRKLVTIDQVCDMIPVVSTVTNLTDLFLKAAFKGPCCSQGVKKDFYAKHIQDKSLVRCILLLLPPCALAFGLFKLMILLVSKTPEGKRAREGVAQAEQREQEVQQKLRETVLIEETRLRDMQQPLIVDPVQQLNEMMEQRKAETTAKQKEQIRKNITDRFNQALEMLKNANENAQKAYETWQQNKNDNEFLVLLLKVLSVELKAALNKTNDFNGLQLMIAPEEWNTFLNSFLKEPEMVSASQKVNQAKEDFIIKIAEFFNYIPKDGTSTLQKLVEKKINDLS